MKFYFFIWDSIKICFLRHNYEMNKTIFLFFFNQLINLGVKFFTIVMIICGLIGSVLSGVILDKTKRFEELAKICFGISTIAAILFTILSLYNNDRSTIYYSTLVSFGLIGFFGIKNNTFAFFIYFNINYLLNA